MQIIIMGYFFNKEKNMKLRKLKKQRLVENSEKDGKESFLNYLMVMVQLILLNEIETFYNFYVHFIVAICIDKKLCPENQHQDNKSRFLFFFYSGIDQKNIF